jgi:hypothetical protein
VISVFLTEGSLPRSQELSTCTYPEPDQSHYVKRDLNVPYENVLVIVVNHRHVRDCMLLQQHFLRF